VQTALLREFSPDLPLSGQLLGALTLTGSTATEFRVNGDVTNVDPVAGNSSVSAVGTVLLRDGFAMRDLRLELDPIQIAALRSFSPDLPVEGVIVGNAVVNGSPQRRVTAAIDLTINAESGQ
jgi:hypothetical protein